MRGVFMVVLLAACAHHAPVAAVPEIQEPLVGSWNLVALEEPGADGALHRADATGQFVFSSQGQVAVQVMYRTPQADTPYVVGGYEATFGTYRVDASSHTFTLHVDGALARALIGKDLPRSYQLVGNQLIVTSTNPAEHWRVTWQRGGTPAASAGDHMVITRAASRPPVRGPAANFVGDVLVTPLFAPTERTNTSGGSVTFQPGARSAWHTHPSGQTLIVTAGAGWAQEWGGPKQELHAGDVVWTPPGVKHWHGATSTTSMTHTAIQEQVDGIAVDWDEPVADEQYR